MNQLVNQLIHRIMAKVAAEAKVVPALPVMVTQPSWWQEMFGTAVGRKLPWPKLE